jgi:ribose/xylose/arabinose/galactoside ABC-type transport system permease subunit
MFSRMTGPTRRRLIFLIAANLVLISAIALLLKEGASFTNVLQRTFPEIAPICLAAFALTGIIYAGGIDLSIASVITLAGTAFGVVVTRWNWAPIPAFLACFTVAWGLIALNGLLIVKSRFPALIVTLAGLPLYRGLALILADAAVPNFSGNITVPGAVYHFPGNTIAGLILVLALASALILEQWGSKPRLWLALGNSEEACRLLGLNPSKILLSAYTVGGAFLGIAALVFVTRVQSIEPARMGLGFELQVIAAVILGGTNIFGGEGSYLGSFLGALFLYFTSQVLVYAGASAYIQEAISGGIILSVIGLDCALHRRAKLMEELA